MLGFLRLIDKIHFKNIYIKFNITLLSLKTRKKLDFE